MFYYVSAPSNTSFCSFFHANLSLTRKKDRLFFKSFVQILSLCITCTICITLFSTFAKQSILLFLFILVIFVLSILYIFLAFFILSALKLKTPVFSLLTLSLSLSLLQRQRFHSFLQLPFFCFSFSLYLLFLVSVLYFSNAFLLYIKLPNFAILFLTFYFTITLQI